MKTATKSSPTLRLARSSNPSFASRRRIRKGESFYGHKQANRTVGSGGAE